MSAGPPSRGRLGRFALAAACVLVALPASAQGATLRFAGRGPSHGRYTFATGALPGYKVLSAALVRGRVRVALAPPRLSPHALRLRPAGRLRACRRRRCRLRLVLSVRPLAVPPPPAAPQPAPQSPQDCALWSGPWPDSCWRPYGDTSPFNRPLPPTPRVAANSAQIVAQLAAWGEPSLSRKISTPGSDTATDYEHPYYFGGPADPAFTIHCVAAWGRCADEGMRVHIPDRARPANGPDAHMAVIDAQGGWEYDFWQVRAKPAGGGQLDIGWGGRTRIGTRDATGLGGGGTASGFGLLAGAIRAPELAAGRIDHALFMVVRCDSGRSVYPADGVGSACAAGAANAPAMGQHFFLDLTDAQISALRAPVYEQAILRAMAHYGLFVGDTGGDPWDIEFESDATYTSLGRPARVRAAFAGYGARHYVDAQYNSLNLDMVPIDWAAHLRVVDPCSDSGAC